MEHKQIYATYILDTKSSMTFGSIQTTTSNPRNVNLPDYSVTIIGRSGAVNKYENTIALLLETLEELKIYPNPASDEVCFNLGMSGEIQLKIINYVVQEVILDNWYNTDPNYIQTITTSSLTAGIYNATISCNCKMITRDFVIEH